MRPPQTLQKIGTALQALAGQPDSPLLTPAEAFKLAHLAAERHFQEQGSEGLTSKKSRWPDLLYRALSMGASAYRRLWATHSIPQTGEPEGAIPAHEQADARAALERRFEELEFLAATAEEFQATVELASSLARLEPAGFRSMLVLGGSMLLAAVYGRLTGARVMLVPWVELDEDRVSALQQVEGLDLLVQDPLRPGAELPFWLRERFDSVVLSAPQDPVSSLKSVGMALASLSPIPGRRLYWTGHPSRQRGYFGLYARLAKAGYFLEQLVPDARRLPLDPAFQEELQQEALARLGSENWDPGVLENLLAARQEFEHLHVVRPADEIVLRGHRIDLVPVLEKDIPLYDAWLNPEFCAEVGLEDAGPRPTLEELRQENWYPDNEWWLFRTKDGASLGILRLILAPFWSARAMPFDLGVAEKSFRGQGFLNEMVRLSFHRVFRQLAAETLWAIVRVANVRICRGYRSNFFQLKKTIPDPRTQELHEYIEVNAAEYEDLLRTGQIDVPLPRHDVAMSAEHA